MYVPVNCMVAGSLPMLHALHRHIPIDHLVLTIEELLCAQAFDCCDRLQLESPGQLLRLLAFRLMMHVPLQVQPEAASKALKDLVFSVWREGGCEGFADTAKSVSMANFYLPFFPLTRPDIAQLFRLKLRDRAAALARQGHPELSWGEEVVDFLTKKVTHTHAAVALHTSVLIFK